MPDTLDRKQKDNATGVRADKLVQRAFPGLSGNQVDEAIETGLVRLKGEGSLSKGSRFSSVEELDFAALATRVEVLRAGNPDLKVPILHEEPDYWVVDKPAGMAGHPLRLSETETLTHWALARDRELLREFSSIQPILTPHRLDLGTSGVLIVARTEETYRAWRYRFEAKGVRKLYLAWCWGVPKEKSWVMALAIGKAKGGQGKMAVQGREARPALSRATVMKTFPDRFLVRVECETGVTHQVRVHLASAGFPLLGDEVYDPEYASRPGIFKWHLLRAIRLEWEGRIYEAETSIFEKAGL